MARSDFAHKTRVCNKHVAGVSVNVDRQGAELGQYWLAN